MIETRRLKNVIFIQTILSFVLSRKIINTEEIRHAYKSKHNLKSKNQVIFLMIRDGEKWCYLAVKNCLH